MIKSEYPGCLYFAITGSSKHLFIAAYWNSCFASYWLVIEEEEHISLASSCLPSFEQDFSSFNIVSIAHEPEHYSQKSSLDLCRIFAIVRYQENDANLSCKDDRSWKQPSIKVGVKGEATPGGDKLLKIIDLLKIHDIVFPDLNIMDNKKATKSELESLWERMERIEKEMREMKQEK